MIHLLVSRNNELCVLRLVDFLGIRLRWFANPCFLRLQILMRLPGKGLPKDCLSRPCMGNRIYGSQMGTAHERILEARCHQLQQGR